MEDRELLELAAKAAGIELHFDADGVSFYYGLYNRWNPMSWNPIKSDGDALRLAVKLRMAVAIFDDAVGIGHGGYSYSEDDIGADPYATTRRAIVRAAAEIGRSMP